MPPSPGERFEKFLKLGYIAADDMREIRNLAAARGIPLLEAALLGNRIQAEARGWILAETLGIPFLEIDPASVPDSLAGLLPEAMARENLIAPVSREGDRLTVAASDPFRHKAFAAVEERTGLSLRLVVSPARTIGHGNKVPSSRINPSGQSLLKVFPLPNFTDWNVSKGAYNYIYQTEATKPIRLGMLRIDYNMSANHMISGSYSDFYDKQEGALDIATATGNWPQMAKGYSFRGQNFLGRYTAILSPTFINELSAGCTRRPQKNTVIEDELQRNQRDKVGFTAGQFNPGINELNIIPNATFGGVPSAGQLAQEARFPFEQNIHQFSLTDNISKIMGTHTLKAGMA